MRKSHRTALQTVADAATPDPESLRPQRLARTVVGGIVRIFTIAGAATGLAWAIAFAASRRAEKQHYPAPVPAAGRTGTSGQNGDGPS
jgi:hypothetical protein